MKTKKTVTIVRPITWTACAFKLLSITAIFLSMNVHSFEYKDYEKKIKTGYSLRSAIEKMPRGDLEKNLREFIASGRPSRLVGTPGHKKAQEYLENKLQSFNSINTHFFKQTFSNPNVLLGINYIWEKKGVVKPEEVLILGAHYDTLLKDPKTRKPVLKGEMPGADNNGSGVAILISMIEILNKLDLPKTVRIVFYDCEEFSAAGSLEFAKKTKEELSTQKIAGIINLIMLGHDSKISDKDKKMNNMNIYLQPRDQVNAEASGKFGQMIVELGKAHFKTVEFLPLETFSADYFPQTSEHFWSQGIPAVTMTQNRNGDLNPRYMTSNDFVETLNLNTYTNVFKYITSAVLAWDYDIVK